MFLVMTKDLGTIHHLRLKKPTMFWTLHPFPSFDGMWTSGESTLVQPLEGTGFNPCHAYGLTPYSESFEIKNKLVIIINVCNKDLQ